MKVLSSKGRHYGKFLSFRFHWALSPASVVFGDPWAAWGAFGRPLGLHLSPMGVHWGASGASLGSICRRWGSVHWDAFEGSWGSICRLWRSIGCHWGSLVASLLEPF